MKKKVLLIVGCVLVIVLSIFILFVVTNKEDKNLDNITNNDDIVQDDENDTNIGELKTKTYKISSEDLYVKNYEKQYTEYSKLTEVNYTTNLKYYINDGDLFKNDDGNISQVNIGGEKAKYLAIGADCGGASVFVLTTAGNVYGQFYIDEESFSQIYNGGDADEILILNESKIFTTCGEKTIYILKNNKLYSIYNGGTSLREEVSPFSIAFYHNDNYNGKILLYPDGTLNNYIYCSDIECNSENHIKNEFMKDEYDNKILVSFVFSMNNINYIIDTNGKIYKIIVPELDRILEETKFSVEKTNDLDIDNVERVEVTSYTRKEMYRYKEYEASVDIEKLILYDHNGRSITYNSQNTSSLKYIDELYH